MVFRASLVFSLLFSLGLLGVLVLGVVGDGIGVLNDRGLDFITSGLSSDPAKAGVWQGIKGSFWIAVIVSVVAFPIGIAAGIYLEEYARPSRFNQLMALNIRNLAGVPSVVYGLLGLALFVQTMRSFTGGRSVLAGGLTLAALVLPIVIISAAEAIRAVPDELREAGYGLGSTRWEVVRQLVLPYAAPGILTGTVLALLRALGEAAPLILVGAISGYFVTANPTIIDELTGKFTALPMVVFSWARQPGAEFRELTSAAIIVMLAFLMTANLAAVLLRNKYERRRHG